MNRLKRTMHQNELVLYGPFIPSILQGTHRTGPISPLTPPMIALSLHIERGVEYKIAHPSYTHEIGTWSAKK